MFNEGLLYNLATANQFGTRMDTHPVMFVTKKSVYSSTLSSIKWKGLLFVILVPFIVKHDKAKFAFGREIVLKGSHTILLSVVSTGFNIPFWAFS